MLFLISTTDNEMDGECDSSACLCVELDPSINRFLFILRWLRLSLKLVGNKSEQRVCACVRVCARGGGEHRA